LHPHAVIRVAASLLRWLVVVFVVVVVLVVVVIATLLRSLLTARCNTTFGGHDQSSSTPLRT